MKVYMIGHYDEHGAEDVVATLKKDQVENIFEQFILFHKYDWSEDTKILDNYKEQRVKDLADARTNLKTLLGKDELITTGMDLFRGWGGPQLYIVELQ